MIGLIQIRPQVDQRVPARELLALETNEELASLQSGVREPQCPFHRVVGLVVEMLYQNEKWISDATTS